MGPLVKELPLVFTNVEIVDTLVWELLVPLPAAEELGCEIVVRTRIVLGVTEDVTLDKDVGLCEDTEENPVPLPGLLGMDDVNDAVCVVEIVSEVNEDPSELYV